MTAELEHYDYDVLIVGAGGAGLRAAIAAREAGLRTAIICKSLFGKAHTVMAEGGIAASMGNVNSNDSWQVHFRDTMRGGKFLNSWRMAELHAKEAPERVWELETYGALFDRTPDGRISQRNFGGHEYPRLAHVGDRTGLELIRTMQQKIVSLQQDDERESGDPESRLKVFAEVTITDLLQDAGGAIAGAFGYWRESGRFVRFNAPAVVLATGGIGKSFKVTSNSWEYTGDGHALALRAGSTLVNMEFIQFHPTGMVWPPSVKGILVTESVRGDGGVLKNSEGRRFMFDYVPDVFRGQYAQTEEEGDRWYTDPDNNKRPPELLPRDEVARAINSEVKAGRGSPHGGVFLDIASRRTPEEILKKLPSMHHQFKELADVDITKEPMEVGPTCHYVMGGVEVDPDTAAAARVPGLFAAGEVSGGMHGSNRLGGNSLSDLLVFGARAGRGAAAYVQSLGGERPSVDQAVIDAAAATALAPFEEDGGENPYTLHQEMQQAMNDLVGIIRTAEEIERALAKLEELKARAHHLTVEGHRQFNPGWHLALDLRNMLAVSECVARAALLRQESRGGHTRDDYPTMDPHWRGRNLICSLDGDAVSVVEQPMPAMREDLLALFDGAELAKYLTPAELAAMPGPAAPATAPTATSTAAPTDGSGA
ncbi:fumarate reductase/succinate dehydrogenase flavoprotein subunit [Terrabacter sp. MAHUQ-38]|uniref:fumarate reductase/succinate dehydrogenase flavoprotein subunit n=1 Tax=unclassified Terrabacter TaxID=2630222 RepID=UPI00165DE7AE|nr:fumarate reductase/succinate dehydrogenase flavoprotein subunit [Terrabacter sp. MAHUQ-38]MBC9821882.1 fumarate reductase/succinate dehydrogenase flavoprotein subunit [Terrabacter sp. MAHUQ-38]